VPEVRTVELMGTLFTNLAAGQLKTDALRNAQFQMVARHAVDNVGSQPFYWAAFTLAGR
jgi:CHAT domain-containing protein